MFSRCSWPIICRNPCGNNSTRTDLIQRRHILDINHNTRSTGRYFLASCIVQTEITRKIWLTSNNSRKLYDIPVMKNAMLLLRRSSIRSEKMHIYCYFCVIFVLAVIPLMFVPCSCNNTIASTSCIAVNRFRASQVLLRLHCA
jgi:hypothetical protein